MESKLEQEFNEIMSQDFVSGCVIADAQGLCLMSSPHVRGEVAGLATAIAQHAALVEPDSCQPVILLESDSRKCLIHNSDGITTAIFKDLSLKPSK